MLSDSSGARSEGGRLFQVAGPNTREAPLASGSPNSGHEKGSSRCRA